MATTPWSGATLPDGSSADNVPADLATFADAIDPLLVLQAADLADRDTRYALLPKGSVVVTANPLAAWVKAVAATPTWDDLNYDTGWISTGFTIQTGWSLGAVGIRKRSGIIDCRVLVGRSGADIVTGASGIHAGNITGDPAIIALPSGWAPSGTLQAHGRASFGMYTIEIATDGTCYITDGAPGATLSSGDNLSFNATWIDG